MTVPVRTRPDPREVALQLAPDRLKSALVSLLAALHENLDHSDDPMQLIDEVATVLEYHLDRDEIGVLLIAFAAAADPADLAALSEALRSPAYSATGAPAWPESTGRNRPRSLTDEERQRAARIPAFDDPDFMTKLHTDSAPLEDRKRLFKTLWCGFDDPTKRASVDWLNKQLNVRRAA